MASHGGARPGAGRKPAPYPRDIRILLSRAVTARDWRSLIRMLVRRAAEGDVRAAQTLLRFRHREGTGPAVVSTRRRSRAAGASRAKVSPRRGKPG